MNYAMIALGALMLVKAVAGILLGFGADGLSEYGTFTRIGIQLDAHSVEIVLGLAVIFLFTDRLRQSKRNIRED